MKEQEQYFFKPRSLTGRKKQTRQDIKIRRHGFWDKGAKNSAQCLSLPFDNFRLHRNWILQAMYFCKTIAIFLRHLSFFFQWIRYGNPQLLSFQKIYSLSGFLFNVSPWNGANAKRSFGVGCYLKRSSVSGYFFSYHCDTKGLENFKNIIVLYNY